MTQKNPTSFRDLIAEWGGVSAFAADMGLEYVTAYKMAERDSIAVRHWPKLLEKAAVKNIHLSTDKLLGFRQGAAA